jgi:hypothetical protein
VAEQLDIEIDPLAEDFEPRSLAAACVGVLSRRSNDRASRITVAARGTGIRWLAEQLAEDPHARSRLRIVAPERLAEHVRSVAAEELAQEAVFGLHAKRPDHSAIGYGWAQLLWFTIFFAAAMLGAAIVAPGELFIAVEYFLALSFISWTLLRLVACLFPRKANPVLDIPTGPYRSTRSSFRSIAKHPSPLCHRQGAGSGRDEILIARGSSRRQSPGIVRGFFLSCGALEYSSSLYHRSNASLE